MLLTLEILLILYLLSGILGIKLFHLLASVFPNILIKLTDNGPAPESQLASVAGYRFRYLKSTTEVML
jgi:hypothetical protein